MILGWLASAEAQSVRPVAVEALAPPAPLVVKGGSGKAGWSVTLVQVPGGTFTAGALPDDPAAQLAPARPAVKVASFWIATTETPVAAFQEYCATPAGAELRQASAALVPLARDRVDCLDDPPGEPVRHVSWYDAVGFANWLTDRELGAGERVYTIDRTGPVPVVAADPSKRGYRLPTGDEWEWAARGGSSDLHGPYAADGWGCGFTNLPHECLRGQADTFDRDEVAPALPTGKVPFAPNGFGLYHLNGNVMEWVGDLRPNAKGAQLVAHRGASYRTASLTGVGDAGVTRDLSRPEHFSEDLPSRQAPDLGFRLARTPSGAALQSGSVSE